MSPGRSRVKRGEGEDGSVTAAPGNGSAESLHIRPPLQRRSRESWQRVLDAGLALLEEGGYEAFTISAVCERAGVPPRALYARASSKDALFLAVYEHGMAALRADEVVFADAARWRGLDTEQLAFQVVQAVGGIFRQHAALLRSVILISGAHAELYRRGARYSQHLGDQVAAVLLEARAHITQPDPEAAVRSVFNVVFSTLVLRTAYGAGFASTATDEEELLTSLGVIVYRYLFGSGPNTDPLSLDS